MKGRRTWKAKLRKILMTIAYKIMFRGNGAEQATGPQHLTYERNVSKTAIWSAFAGVDDVWLSENIE